jgi:hypothetical protein
MSTTTETAPTAPTPPAPAAPRVPEASALVLFAVIRASSKYEHQNREVNGKAVPQKVRRLENSDYAFHLANGNRYRREDLTFYVRNFDGQLVKLR